MTAKKSRKKVFSVVKAVKANARERVGQPKPVKLMAEKPRAVRGKKPSLKEILDQHD